MAPSTRSRNRLADLEPGARSPAAGAGRAQCQQRHCLGMLPAGRLPLSLYPVLQPAGSAVSRQLLLEAHSHVRAVTLCPDWGSRLSACQVQQQQPLPSALPTRWSPWSLLCMPALPPLVLQLLPLLGQTAMLQPLAAHCQLLGAYSGPWLCRRQRRTATSTCCSSVCCKMTH